MDENVKELYTALVGNKLFGQEGAIKRIETLEETHEQWKTKVNWMYGYIFGIASIATIVVEFLKAKFKQMKKIDKRVWWSLPIILGIYLVFR